MSDTAVALQVAFDALIVLAIAMLARGRVAASVAPRLGAEAPRSDGDDEGSWAALARHRALLARFRRSQAARPRGDLEV